MKTIKRLTALAAAVLCLVTAAAIAETKPQETYIGGKLSKIQWTDENGKPAAGPDGYAEVRYTYHGAEVTERYYDSEGNPYWMQGGYAGRTVTKSKGLVTEIIYLNDKAETIMNDQGYARVTMTYTSFGGMTYLRYYGPNGRKVTVPGLGYSVMETKYSGKEITSRTWLNENGNPVNNAQGYAVMKQKLNTKHQVIRTRFEHADGSSAMCEDGWSLRVIDRDAKGRVTCVSYYDTDDRPADRGLGFVKETTEYGDDTELVTRYAADGSRVPWYGDAVILRRKMNEDRVVSETWLNAQRDPTDGPMGVSTAVYSYDVTGRLETVRYQNAAGEGTLCSEGYAGYRDSRDTDGMIVTRTFLGADGKPALTSAGYSEIRYQYDEMKQLAGIRYYDLNGNPVK